MAIEQKLNNTNYGITFDRAYLKVMDVLLKPNNNQVRIDLRGYASKEARDSINGYEEKRRQLDAIRFNPNSSDEEIRRLEDELGKKPVGVYRDRIEAHFSDIEPFCTGFSREKILEACYLYIKSLDRYKDAQDV